MPGTLPSCAVVPDRLAMDSVPEAAGEVETGGSGGGMGRKPAAGLGAAPSAAFNTTPRGTAAAWVAARATGGKWFETGASAGWSPRARGGATGVALNAVAAGSMARRKAGMGGMGTTGFDTLTGNAKDAIRGGGGEFKFDIVSGWFLSCNVLAGGNDVDVDTCVRIGGCVDIGAGTTIGSGVKGSRRGMTTLDGLTWL